MNPSADPAAQPIETSAQPDTASGVAPQPDPAEAPEMTIDEYADQLTAIWSQLADASSVLAANVTNTWWNSLPIARPQGFDMAGTAAVMAARLAKLGPEGDPVEMLTMNLIAFAQSSRDQALAEVEHIEQQRRALHDAED